MRKISFILFVIFSFPFILLASNLDSTANNDSSNISKLSPTRTNKNYRKSETSSIPSGDMASRALIGSKVPTKCPKNMAYIIIDDNLDRIYEVCIDKYEYPNIKGKYPSVNVSWYKANKLCEKQNKYLCYDNEWKEACKGRSNYDFSYYNIFDSTYCNTNSDKIMPSGSFPKCVTRGYNVYDLLGNVWEWTGSGGIGIKGGDFTSGKKATAKLWKAMSIKDKESNIGFRCCLRVKTGRYEKVDLKKLKSKKKLKKLEKKTSTKDTVKVEKTILKKSEEVSK